MTQPTVRLGRYGKKDHDLVPNKRGPGIPGVRCETGRWAEHPSEINPNRPATGKPCRYCAEARAKAEAK